MLIFFIVNLSFSDNMFQKIDFYNDDWQLILENVEDENINLSKI
jgi:hypothetical protein